jgi:hypothetical protein
MMKYEGVATLGVNLNRQKYGPLDVSSVLLTLNDLKAYCAGDASKMSEGWTGGTPYPYPGQIIVVLENNTVYQLKEEQDGSVKPYTLINLSDYYSKSQIDEMFANVSIDMSDYYTKEQIDNLLVSVKPPEVDLSNYYTKGEIDDIVGSIEGTGDSTITMAMTTDEILAAIGMAGEGVPVTPSGQVLTEMSAEDVQKIVNR